MTTQRDRDRRLTDDEIMDFADSWAPDLPATIDWEDYLYRMETSLVVDLPDRMDAPEIRRIQRVTRAAVRARA